MARKRRFEAAEYWLVRFFTDLAPIRLPLWGKLAATTGIVLVTAVIRYGLRAQLTGFPYLTFFAAVIVSATLFEGWMGVFAAALSILAAALFFLPPERVHSLHFALFVVIAIVNGLVIEALHLSVKRTRTALEAVETERTRRSGPRASRRCSCASCPTGFETTWPCSSAC